MEEQMIDIVMKTKNRKAGFSLMEDEGIEEVLRGFVGVLVAWGYMEETVLMGMLELGEDYERYKEGNRWCADETSKGYGSAE